MFDKIYDFCIAYEDLIKILICLFIFISLVVLFSNFIDKQYKREIDIIEKTKEYTIFSSCQKINDKYYCWED